ncbi:MAG TPA: hypothetical protein DEV87_04065 [Clostridiales bacterium]|nr:hypothetical protein [Clostridiales bacterium]
MEHKKTTYTPVPALDCAKDYGYTTKASAMDIAMDLKFLLRDFYLATFDVSGETLNINFENGQKFKLTVKEV